jgi:hypothetical protein
MQDICFKRNDSVRYEGFTAVTVKNFFFWDVAPCRSYVNRRFGEIYRLHLQGRKIRDGGDTFLRNVGSRKIYMAPHPRRRHSLQ